MTDLTDKWKKGELPEDWYYLEVKEELANYPIIAECVKEWALGQTYSYFLDYDENSIKKVLAKVPTYEEYQALLSDQLAKNEGVEINAELKAENERLKTFLKKAINLVMESNWENHAHYKESIQLRDETNNLLNDSPSPTDLKQG